MRSARTALVALATFALVAGCSNAPATTPAAPTTAATTVTDTAATLAASGSCPSDTAAAGEALRGSTHYDYPPFETIGEAVKASDIAVAGHVTGWHAGRSVIDANDATRHAVVAVQVDETYHGNADGTVYVSVRLGTEGLDAEGKPVPGGDGSSTVLTLEEAQSAAPVGTEIIVVGLQNPSPKEEAYAKDVRVEGARAGIPEGATLYTPSPQGLLIEGCDGTMTSAVAEDEDLTAWITAAGRQATTPEITSTASVGSFDLLRTAARVG